MKFKGDQELVLEIGLGLLAAGILAGIGTVLFGKSIGEARHAQRHAEPPPEAGSTPASRHGNISTVAAR